MTDDQMWWQMAEPEYEPEPQVYPVLLQEAEVNVELPAPSYILGGREPWTPLIDRGKLLNIEMTLSFPNGIPEGRKAWTPEQMRRSVAVMLDVSDEAVDIYDQRGY